MSRIGIPCLLLMTCLNNYKGQVIIPKLICDPDITSRESAKSTSQSELVMVNMNSQLVSRIALGVFMVLMNRVCKPHLDQFVIVFIDDILIYSKSKKDHEEDFQLILELLKSKQHYEKFSKCDFWTQEVQFLGHIVNEIGIHVDPSKFESIKIWQLLKLV